MLTGGSAVKQVLWSLWSELMSVSRALTSALCSHSAQVA